ncbi:MAG TPA: hypothetical protein VGW12_02710 [Pyrinomonadaceae bacterium]|nr:hypothetical protein [Pyrinomonadaceae bacterium]
MPESRFSTHRRSVSARRLFVVFCCAVLVSAVSVIVYGQAGRRVVTRKSDPPVPKAAEPETTPTPQPKETEKVSLVVASSDSAMMSRLSLNADDLVQGAVVQRLRDSASLQIASGGRLSRGEANKRAKSETTKTYVVWFELQNGASGLYDPTRRNSTDEYYVDYVVLEPGTAKKKTDGKVYLRPTGISRIGTIGIGRSLPRCYPQGLSGIEITLAEAGIETAERIFRAFSLPHPPLCS